METYRALGRTLPSALFSMGRLPSIRPFVKHREFSIWDVSKIVKSHFSKLLNDCEKPFLNSFSKLLNDCEMPSQCFSMIENPHVFNVLQDFSKLLNDCEVPSQSFSMIVKRHFSKSKKTFLKTEMGPRSKPAHCCASPLLKPSPCRLLLSAYPLAAPPGCLLAASDRAASGMLLIWLLLVMIWLLLAAPGCSGQLLALLAALASSWLMQGPGPLPCTSKEGMDLSRHLPALEQLPHGCMEQ